MNGIAFIGKMGSGKSTLTRALFAELRPNIKVMPKIYSFATGVKDCASEYFNQKEKDRELYVNIGMKMREIKENVWIEYLHSKMQEDHLRCQQTKTRHIPIIDDLRFQNEYDYLKERNFFIVQLNIPEEERIKRLKKLYPEDWETHTKYSSHTSENLNITSDLDLDSTDSLIYNVELIKKYVHL